MKEEKYGNFTSDKLKNVMDDIFLNRVESKRKFKAYIYGSEEQIEEWVKDFNEAVKKEIEKLPLNESL